VTVCVTQMSVQGFEAAVVFQRLAGFDPW